MADSGDKAAGKVAGTWSDGELADSGQENASGNHALSAAGTAAEPASEADALVIPAAEDDPLEHLFRADQTLRAPSIPAAPSEAEVTRWRATMRTSMFDERVSDPAPVQDEPLREQPRGGVTGPGLAEPVRPPPVVQRVELLEPSLPAPPPAGSGSVEPPPVPPSGKRPKALQRSGVRSKQDVDHEEAVAAPHAPRPSAREPEQTPAPARRRRLQRGPKPALLGALGGAALLVIATLAVVLGLVDSPLAPLASEGAGALHEPPARAAPAPSAAPAQPETRSAEQPLAPGAETQPVAAEGTVAAAPAADEPAPDAVPARRLAAGDRPAAAAPAAAEPAAVPAVAPHERAEPRPALPARRQPPAAEPSKAQNTAALMTTARRYLADDEPEKAEAAMRELLGQDAQNHHAMELLVRALMDQDRGADAVPFARKMVRRRGKRVPYRLLLGDVLLMTGDENAARAEWKKALELAPEDREIQRRLGM